MPDEKPTRSLALLEQRVRDLSAAVEAAVTDQGSYEEAARSLLEIVALRDEVKELYADQVATAHAAHKAAVAERKQYDGPLAEAEASLREQLGGYEPEQECAWLSHRVTYGFEVEDIERVPRQFLVLDEKKLKEVARSQGDAFAVPGLRPVRVTSVAIDRKGVESDKEKGEAA